MSLSPEQTQFFQEQGYLILKNLLSNGEVHNLKTWAQEVHDWKPTPTSMFMPYEVCLDFDNPSRKEW